MPESMSVFLPMSAIVFAPVLTSIFVSSKCSSFECHSMFLRRMFLLDVEHSFANNEVLFDSLCAGEVTNTCDCLHKHCTSCDVMWLSHVWGLCWYNDNDDHSDNNENDGNNHNDDSNHSQVHFDNNHENDMNDIHDMTANNGNHELNDHNDNNNNNNNNNDNNDNDDHDNNDVCDSHDFDDMNGDNDNNDNNHDYANDYHNDDGVSEKKQPSYRIHHNLSPGLRCSGAQPR